MQNRRPKRTFPADGKTGAAAMIRALVVDIDGTLSDETRVLCPSAIRTLRQLRREKIPVVLSTGNTHCFTRTVSVLLGTPRIYIAESGGVLSYSEDEMEILADLGVCEDAFKKLSTEFPMERYNSARYRFTDIALQRTFDAKAADRRAQELDLPVEIIDTTYAIHIKDKRVDKGTGLVRIAGRMKIDLSEYAAIGDSNGDIPMHRLAGFRASVANATDSLKQISDYVAKAEYGNGFAEIVSYMKEKGML